MDAKLQQIIDGSEDYVPKASGKIVEGDFRRRVMLPGQAGRLMDDFASELSKELRSRPIFNHGGIVSVLDERTYGLRRITPTKFRSWVESPEHGNVVCQGWHGRGKDSSVMDMTMNEECAKAVLESPRFISNLREVARVNTVRLPVTRGDGSIDLLGGTGDGYDPESKILTVETIDYDENLSKEDAFATFENLLKDTAFDPKDKLRSVSAATAMILAPFCDCMLSRFDERPAFIVTANSDGAGKTMLIRMAICPVFGPAKLTPPPHVDSDKLTELLNSIAQSGAPYVVFDNWRGKIENAALEAFVTANQMGGRILGTSYTFDVEKQCLVFISGNQAIIGSDMRRRSLFIQLFVEEARSEDRKVDDPINERIILSRRADILAACWAYVRAWRDAGCPKSERRHLSFPEWGYMIAGILENMSYPCPLDPPANELSSVLDSMNKLCAGAMAGVVTEEVYLSPSDLMGVARAVGAFPWKIADEEPTGSSADKDKRAERASLARYCEIYRGRTFTVSVDGSEIKIHFDVVGDGHARRYRFNRK